MMGLRSRLASAALILAFAFAFALGSGCSVSTLTAEPTPGPAARAPVQAATKAAEPTATADGQASGSPESLTSDEVSVGAPTVSSPASSRVVVESSAGELFLIDGDGDNRLDLSSGDETIARHPVWSPDGRRIGWSEVTPAGPAIASSNAQGGERRRAETPFSGYFGYWNPTSTLLGFLGEADSGTGMVLDDGSGSPLNDLVDNDSFYYYSWSPDGARWVVHSGSGIRIMSTDGSDGTFVDLKPGRFRAPVWTPDGSVLLAVPDDDGNVIVRLNPETGGVRPVLGVGDITNFVLDRSGRYLAVESVHVDLDASPETLISQPADDARLERAEVLVHDLTTGETVVAWENISAGFWWSPDGTTLAILVGADEPAMARWSVWRGGDSFLGEPFRLTRNYAAGYAPFFDQFAQSVTPWAPDSSRFVYAGENGDGDSGVFVQRAEPGTPPNRIAAEGVVAFWSPT